MKVTYLNNGIRYHRNCDNICGFANYYGLVYNTPDGDSVIWLDEKDTIIECVGTNYDHKKN